MLKKLFITLPISLVLAGEEAVETPANVEVNAAGEATDAAIPSTATEGEDATAAGDDMKIPEDMDFGDLLGGKDGENVEDSMKKLEAMLKQMEDLGIDMKSLGKGAAGKAAPTASEKMTACANLVAKHAGQYKSYTLSQLGEIEGGVAAASVAQNDLMQQMVICSEKISDEDYQLYKSRKMKKLTEELYNEYYAELGPSAEKKLMELDPLLFDAAQTVATALIESGDRKQAKNAQTTGGVPGWMGIAILAVFFGAIAVLAWIVVQMQRNLEKKKVPVSGKKDKKRR